MSGANRPHGFPVPLLPLAVLVPLASSEPEPKNSPAHAFLNTPGPAVPWPDVAAWPNSEPPRLFQVICGAMASTRWS